MRRQVKDQPTTPSKVAFFLFQRRRRSELLCATSRILFSLGLGPAQEGSGQQQKGLKNESLGALLLAGWLEVFVGLVLFVGPSDLPLTLHSINWGMEKEWIHPKEGIFLKCI